MLNRIIRLSVDNRLVVLLLAIMILVGGCITLVKSEIDIFPDLNSPTVVVMTEAPGLAPEEVEKLVTFPIETAVNGATGVRRVRSSSDTGFSCIWVEFDWGEDIYVARQIVSEKLASVVESLPPEVGTPVLGPQSSILGEIIIIGLTYNNADTVPQTTEAAHAQLVNLRSIADREIAPRLLSVKGVSSVAVLGGDVAQYQILLSPEKMKFHRVALKDALEAVEMLNENVAGGIIYEYGNEYIVKAQINTADIEDLKQTPIPSESAMPVKLSDIADVKIGAAEPRTGLASVNRQPAVLLTITKQPATGSIELTRAIDATLLEIAPNLPPGVEITSDIFRQSDFIANSVSNLQASLLEGALMVILVLFFFMMNLRTAMISLVALPMSIIITIIILHLMGMTINTMSLGGIAIAIGSLVDDAIVDVENVYKRLRQNMMLPPKERRRNIDVVYQASKEVRMPIFNSSLIIIAGFIPLFFLSGMEGRMLQPLGIAFIVSLAASTITALTVTPVLCSYLPTSTKETGSLSRDPWATRHLKQAFGKSLEWCMKRQRLVLISVGVLFAVALGLLFTLGRSFLPPFNEGSMTINVSTLPGTSLEESNRIGLLAESIILDTPEVKRVARKTGRAELDEHSFGVNVSEIEAPYTLADRSRNEMVRDLRSRLSDIPGVNIEIGQPISHRIDAMLSGTEAQIAVKIFGDDLNRLFAVGREVREAMGEVPGITDINIEQQIERPQLIIKPRRNMLSQYGITLPEFRNMLEVAMTGKEVSQVYKGNIPYSVVVKYEENSRNSIDAIGDLLIDSPQGKIPLKYVADISSASGPNTIHRENTKRRIVVSANIDNSDLRGAVNRLQEIVAEDVTLPEGYYISYEGQFESESRATKTLVITSLLALLVIFVLLYAEFHRIDQSLVILINMPLAMIGGVLILVFTGGDLNIPAIIGFISLLGIATRNGMLLISRYNSLERMGMPMKERIKAGSLDRLTPIIMTALTSALALLPLALRSSVPGNEIQSPMAVVILGGLISSTALNLFVVPILYRYITKRRKAALPPVADSSKNTSLSE